MEDRSSFVAARRLSRQGLETSGGCHSTSVKLGRVACSLDLWYIGCCLRTLSSREQFGHKMDLDLAYSRQPLLNRHDVDYNDDQWEEKKPKEKEAWAQVLCSLIAQWAKWFVEVVAGSAAWIGRGLSCVCAPRRGNNDRVSIDLTPLQEDRLQRLQHRIEVSFNSSRPDHQEALKALWYVAFPGQEFLGLISEQWKEMGWQGKDPSTDFRGGGFISLENLLFFAKTFPKSFWCLLHKQEGNRATWEYPFAVAGVNITFMLIQMLELQSEKPSTLIGTIFLKMLADDEWAFDLLYCIAFKMMDAQWLAMHASYMEFNAVMKATRAQLERELQMEDVLRLEDMPSYNLLSQ